MAQKLPRITKDIVHDAELDHFGKEDYRSLVRLNALRFLYHLQRGQPRLSRKYWKLKGVRGAVQKILEGKLPIVRRRNTHLIHLRHPSTKELLSGKVKGWRKDI